MDPRIRLDSNKKRLQVIVNQMNSLEQQKHLLLSESLRIEGEQRLLEEQIKEAEELGKELDRNAG